MNTKSTNTMEHKGTFSITILRYGIRYLFDEERPWTEALNLIFWDCQDLGLSASVEYHNGMFQEPGETLDDWQEPYLDESQRGYSIQIAGYYVSGEDGITERRFPTIVEATSAALHLLDSILEEMETE